MPRLPELRQHERLQLRPVVVFGLVDRSAARGEAPAAHRPAAPSPRGPVAPDDDGLRSASPWFGRHESVAAEPTFRTGSGWTTGGTAARPLAVVARVGSPTRADWRHPAVQLR